tara:strand:+ start:3245 stop:4339 length:1095 start_codon:yes stop_codon:yes gene_type:complete
MKLKFLLPLALALLVYSCTSKTKSKEGVNIENDLVLSGTIVTDSISILDEDNELLGQISSMAFITKSKFVVATKAGSIVTYNLMGERVGGFSNIGTGPYEYVSPGKIKIYDNRIYLWCSQLLKLIVFDLEGNPIQEYTKFSTAIKDFVVVDNKIYFYMSGGSLYSLIEVYDLNTQKSIAFHGEEDRSSEILSMLSCSGGLAINNGNIYFSPVGQLKIESIKNGSIIMQKSLVDNEFRVTELDNVNYGKLRDDIEARVNYVNQNSYVGGIFIINNQIVIKTDVGQFVYDNVWDSKTWNISKRYEKYFILDEELNLIATYKRPFSLNCKNCLYAENSENLYFLTEVEKANGDDYEYQLNKLVFDSK